MGKLTPLKAAREKCKWCVLGALSEISRCQSVECPLHLVRDGKKGEFRGSVLGLIRDKCVECASGAKEARECKDTKCPLHGFRMGENPHLKSIPRVPPKSPDKSA